MLSHLPLNSLLTQDYFDFPLCYLPEILKFVFLSLVYNSFWINFYKRQKTCI